MERFDEIRPYHDDEVRPTLDRLLQDAELLHMLSHHQFPRLSEWLGGIMYWLTGRGLRSRLKGVDNIDALQKIIEPYLSSVIESSTSRITYSGIENLKPGKAYTYLSNHRDIVMDPAFVNYGIYKNGMTTARIAIGDNLLQRPFVSDLMRLNKSFIVKRSLSGRREKLKAFQTLSAYIHHSIDTGHSVWIAQSEGRAKDGNDLTDSAIIKMFHMSRKAADASFSESIRSMNIVPVSISYEYDPCDNMKARELYETEKNGHYTKSEGEDMYSIVKGIEGQKGHVHIAFGKPLKDHYESANEVVSEVDRQIHKNYQLQPSNLFAWEALKDLHTGTAVPDLETLFPNENLENKRAIFEQRLATARERHRDWLLKMYATPVFNRYL
ncbi:1-acyl-sn-glycerol-3-phosphate acyltransferase [Endozoicomonas gorgoniicola]|uniref:1-acyl-sn-glycerol-3-phosphate acyltransferase n=1 Tax=Endozoicomonas gorgoniicola TaxID=1234144 RepID=A0ABT3MVD6_9GAMM|nr:1-acyl-sn-glycerol-3-phosphate acyltransferase [Endozoicomonas gorgoniicola]MCW7553357.1 1-acyl-sn-glycerol-3-phosphate acyltransferase [Endozoicomonas gorgoniicola]